MNNHTKILGALVGLLILLSIEARSQDSIRVVILSPRLGAVITRGQGEQYNIFQSYVGLQKAVVCQARSDSFYIWIETRSKTGEVVHELVPYPYSVLKMMAEKVDHYEEIAAGRYVMGERPVELRFADSTVACAAVVPPHPTEVALLSAVGPDDRTVMEALERVDERYAILLPGQEVNVKYRAKESTPSVKVTYALGVRGYLHEWLPGASPEGASIITASMTGEMEIAFLKTLLRMKNVFLPPIYAEWKKSREYEGAIFGLFFVFACFC